jgi:amino acid permease
MNSSITEALTDMPSPRRGNFIQRNFKRMNTGSLRGAVFSLMCTSVGAGILSMPYILRTCGFVLGILIIIIGGTLSLISSMLIMESQKMTGAQSFPELVTKTLGKSNAKFLEFIIILTGYSVSVAYFVILATDVEQLLYTFFISEETATKWWMWYLIIGVATLLELPLVMMRRIDQLRYFSFFGVLSTIYPAVLIVCLSPVFIFNEFYPRTYTAFKFSPNLITSLSIGLFSYECQIVAIPVKQVLKNATDIRIFKVPFIFKFSFFAFRYLD